MKKLLIILGLSFLGVIVSTFVSGFLYYQSAINRTIELPDGKKIALTIDRGMSVDEIGAYLKSQGLVENPFILKAYLYMNRGKNIQAGYYEISEKNLSLVGLVDALQKGSFEKKLTFIEGWRIEQYIDYLENEMGVEYADDFASSAQISEGYMFPDTYTIEADYEPELLAKKMRDNFNSKSKSNNWETKAAAINMSLKDVVILASIVEREMNIKSERRTVAGVLMNRLKIGMPLQADAAVQYAKGTSADWWPKLLGEDTRTINSPFNTYLNKDLPPAPICNPSADSINAVLEYAETSYLFYSTGNDGITRYTETLDKHNENIAKYLR